MASYLTPLPLCEEFAAGVFTLSAGITFLQLRYLPISLIKMEGIQIGLQIGIQIDHGIKDKRKAYFY